mgnify:CR=1 FL=1
MRRRNTRKRSLILEQCESRLLLSVGGTVPVKSAAVPVEAPRATRGRAVPPLALVRITNPTPFNARLVPPFRQIKVQDREPIPGQVYNVVFATVRNSTNRKYTSDDGFFVRVTGQTKEHKYPILTGDQVWRPGQVIVFYFLTKRYYPLRPVQSAGFQFDLGGFPGTAIPGPSGFFQRIHYLNPQSFERVLNGIVPYGPGARGTYLGLPNTSIWEFLPANQAGVPL